MKPFVYIKPTLMKPKVKNMQLPPIAMAFEENGEEYMLIDQERYVYYSPKEIWEEVKENSQFQFSDLP